MKVPSPKKLQSGNYNIYLRLGGENISITRNTAKECTQAAQLVKAEYMSGKRKAVTGGSMTLYNAIDKYIQAKALLSPSTIRGYRVIQKKYFQDVSDKPLRNIDWQTAINKEAERLAPKTVINAWRFISSVLKFNGYPVPEVTLPQKIKEERPFLDYDQIIKFMDAIKGKDFEPAALLALHTLRRSEILALKYEDIYDGIIHVRGAAVLDENGTMKIKKQNKTYESTRDIPIMIPRLSEVIQGRTGAVYTNRPNTLYSVINIVCEEQGLPKVGVHGLRHSAASLMLSDKVGMSEVEVCEIGGWSDYRTVHEIYLHVAKQERMQHQNKMARLFTEISNADKNENDSQKVQ